MHFFTHSCPENKTWPHLLISHHFFHMAWQPKTCQKITSSAFCLRKYKAFKFLLWRHRCRCNSITPTPTVASIKHYSLAPQTRIWNCLWSKLAKSWSSGHTCLPISGFLRRSREHWDSRGGGKYNHRAYYQSLDSGWKTASVRCVLTPRIAPHSASCLLTSVFKPIYF